MSYFLSKGLSKRPRSEKLAAFSGTSGICFSVKASYGTITLACFFFFWFFSQGKKKKSVFKSRDWIRSTQNTREARISLAANTSALHLVLWKGYIRMLGWKKKKINAQTHGEAQNPVELSWAEIPYVEAALQGTIRILRKKSTFLHTQKVIFLFFFEPLSTRRLSPCQGGTWSSLR